MASPHVAGAAALLLSQNPEVTFLELKNILLNSVDPIDAFKDKMVSGGRLNLLKAVETHGPNSLEVSPTSGSSGGRKNQSYPDNAENLVAGTKQAVVSLKTNDPLAQTIEVPVHLTITGTPEIEVDPTYVSFGSYGPEKRLPASLLFSIPELMSWRFQIWNLDTMHFRVSLMA